MKPANSQVASSVQRTVRSVQVLCLLAAASVLLLVSCRNPGRDLEASADQECVYVEVTGSNLPVKQCRTREEREALAAQAARERDGAEEGLDDLQDLQEFGVENGGF
jgi:hypothetical protein